MGVERGSGYMGGSFFLSCSRGTVVPCAQAGADIDKVARLHIENGNMPTFYHIFRQGGDEGGGAWGE